MLRTALRTRSFLLATAIAAVGCVSEGDPDDEDPLLAAAADAGKADSGRLAPREVTPQIRWLAERSEWELSQLFARGTATHLPLGQNRQQPLVGHLGGAGLLPLVQELFHGTLWVDEGERQPDGSPAFAVYSVYTPGHGPVVAPYSGRATLSRIAELEPASGALPPTGLSAPHALSSYRYSIQMDDKPSVFVDYQADPTPILGRSIDEFREIDAAGCPGLYLVRTHYLQSYSQNRWVYLFYIASDFGPADRVCDLARLL
jgi:hypothetical protein